VEKFVRLTAPTGKVDFVIKLAVLVVISGFFNHLRDVITSVGGDYRSFLHNTMDASWTALPMCTFALLLIGHLNRLQQQLYAQARIDPLTNLPNRRSFLDRFSRLTSGRHVLIMLDVDYFKQVNDLYGHEAGDRCLKLIAQHLSGSLQGNGFCARLGGEEFAILLDRATDKEVEHAVETLVGGVAYTPVDAPTIQVTLSAGIVKFEGTSDASVVMRAADVALYQAKQNGRARYEIAADLSLPVQTSIQTALGGLTQVANA